MFQNKTRGSESEQCIFIHNLFFINQINISPTENVGGFNIIQIEGTKSIIETNEIFKNDLKSIISIIFTKNIILQI